MQSIYATMPDSTTASRCGFGGIPGVPVEQHCIDYKGRLKCAGVRHRFNFKMRSRTEETKQDMKIGANSFIWTDSFGVGNFDVLRKVADAGLDGIEIGLLNPSEFPAGKVGKELQRLGLGCTVCSVLPPGCSLVSAEETARKKGKDYVVSCLEATAEVGGEILCGPLYAPVGQFTGTRRTPDEWARSVECWQELSPIAKGLNVEVAIEPLNRFETYFLNTVSDASNFCSAVDHPSVGILVDTFHANIEEKSIGDALKAAGAHLKHLHSCESDRGIPGTGNVHWPEFFEAVREHGYDRWLVIESFGFSLGTLSAAASIWRDLAANPEDIAFQGAAFLRQQIGSPK